MRGGNLVILKFFAQAVYERLLDILADRMNREEVWFIHDKDISVFKEHGFVEGDFGLVLELAEVL